MWPMGPPPPPGGAGLAAAARVENMAHVNAAFQETAYMQAEAERKREAPLQTAAYSLNQAD